MDPQAVSAADWTEISRVLILLYLFCGLGLASALSFLFGHAIVPSLVESRDAPRAIAVLRWAAYPLALVGTVLTVYALARAFGLATDLMLRIYSRTWM